VRSCIFSWLIIPFDDESAEDTTTGEEEEKEKAAAELDIQWSLRGHLVKLKCRGGLLVCEELAAGEIHVFPIETSTFDEIQT